MIKVRIKKYLNERKSDILYSKITKYFADLLADKSKIGYELNKYPVGGNYTPVVKIAFNDDAISEDGYRDYIEKTNDDKILNSYEKFYRTIYELKILLCPNWIRPDASGDMDNDGTMRIFSAPRFNTIDIDMLNNVDGGGSFLGHEAAKMFFPEALQYFEDVKNKDIFTIITKRTFIHEMAHYLNAVRSAGTNKSKVVKRAKGGDKQFFPHEREYAESTEEWQARLTEVFSELEKIVNLKLPQGFDSQKDLKELSVEQLKQKYIPILEKNINLGLPPPPPGFPPWENTLIAKVIPAMLENNFSKFYEAVISFSGASSYLERSKLKTNQNVKKRIYSAFVSFTEDLQQSPLYDLYRKIIIYTEKL